MIADIGNNAMQFVERFVDILPISSHGMVYEKGFKLLFCVFMIYFPTAWRSGWAHKRQLQSSSSYLV